MSIFKKRVWPEPPEEEKSYGVKMSSCDCEIRHERFRERKHFWRAQLTKDGLRWVFNCSNCRATWPSGLRVNR